MKLNAPVGLASKCMDDAQQIALPVPLDSWTLTASIDFISLTMPSRPDLYRLKHVLLDQAITDRGHVEVPAAKRGQRDVLTIHDPSMVQLQRLIDIYPGASIFQAEFSIDFRPGGADPACVDELAPVFRWLADSLYPASLKAKRYSWDSQIGQRGRYVPTRSGPSESLTTHLWRDGWERIKQRLYLKTMDRGGAVERPSVRLEVSMNMTACSRAHLAKAWQLATFGQDLRRTLMPCFQIAAGIKPKLKRMRHLEGTRIARETEAANAKEINRVERFWLRQGAMWAVQNGYSIVPDKVAHKRIGNALHRLGDHVAQLKLPENSRVTLDVQPPESRTLLELNDWTTELPIGVILKGGVPERLTIRKKPVRTKRNDGY